MHLGNRTHHPGEDFQSQEGQETVDSWSEKRKKSLLIFVVKNDPKSNSRYAIFLPQSLLHRSTWTKCFPQKNLNPSLLPPTTMVSLTRRGGRNHLRETGSLTHKELIQKSIWAEPWLGYLPDDLEEAATNSLLLSAITSPTTREQMPPALHQGPVILHRRALPLAALTHLTHRVTQREETRWEILPTSWLLRNTPL